MKLTPRGQFVLGLLIGLALVFGLMLLQFLDHLIK